MADYAVAAGYVAEVIADGRDALHAARQCMPDLIVLDIQLPGLDGLSLCRALRRESEVPIILVTAKVEEIDRLLGLESGADDYLCKPFSPRELIARIRVILRRTRGGGEAQRLISVDEAAQTIHVQSQRLELTPTEYRLLAAMARRPGTIHSRAQLLDLARHDALDISDRVIDTHVKNLRRKLAAVLPGVELIQSVYGLGYRVEL